MRRVATLRRMPNRACRHPARRRTAAAALAAVALALAACQRTPPPSNITPQKAVATSLRLTATGDFDSLMQYRLPPPDYAKWRTEWDRARTAPPPPSPAQAQQFAVIMQKFTAPDAERALMKQFKPQLPALRGGKGSLPIFAGILQAAGSQMIAESPQLGPAQRALAAQGLAALVGWAQTTDFSDARKAQKAIDLACATARSLHVRTLAQWRALDYATAMRDYGILWKGLEDLLHLYGLNVVKSLDNARISAVDQAPDRATIRLEVEFAGRALTGQWAMQKLNGHWYDAALLDAWRAAHPAGAAPSAGGSAGAPAAVAGTAAAAKPGASAP